MPADLFGTPTGFRAYDEDQRQLADLAGATMLRAGQAEHQKSLSLLNQAQAFDYMRKADLATAEQALREKAMAGLAGGAATGGATDPQDFFARALTGADVLARGGDLKGAKELMDMATLGQQRIAAAGASQASEQLRKVRAAMEQNEFIQSRLSAVNNAADYATARMHILASPIMQGADLTDMPAQYDPRFVRAAVAGSKAANDQLRLKMDQADLARKQTDSGVRNKIAKANFDLNERKAAAYESRVDALNKAGGLTAGSKEKPIGIASDDELTAMKDDLKTLGYNVRDSTAFKSQARELADEAKYLYMKRKISPTEARAQVLKEALDRGDIKLDNPTFGLNNTTFKSTQGSYAKPIPIKKGMFIEDLKPNMYYRLENGDIKKFDPEELKAAAPQPLPRPPANNPLSEDDEE